MDRTNFCRLRERGALRSFLDAKRYAKGSNYNNRMNPYHYGDLGCVVVGLS